jgi:hypothetical protein
VIDYSFRKYKRSVAKNPLNFSKEIKKKQREGLHTKLIKEKYLAKMKTRETMGSWKKSSLVFFNAV